MRSLSSPLSLTTCKIRTNYDCTSCFNLPATSLATVTPFLYLPLSVQSSSLLPCSRCFSLVPRSLSTKNGDFEEDQNAQVQDLRVPDNWLNPPKALEESEWLRLTLHKWLDDEYCPEETNVEISRVAARSYYKCLLEKRTDLGEILLKMARELESISYKDSFHGAFSSANAAVNLIIQRIEQV